MNSPPIATRRHTLIFLAIFAVLFLAGLQNARSATPLAEGTAQSHLPLYASIIVMQLLLFIFVRRPLRKRGLPLTALTEERANGTSAMTPTRLAVELLLGILFAAAMHYLLIAARTQLGVIDDRTSALLPHGIAESGLWIVVSIAAGVCEELAFRGYLQRQFTAFFSSRAIATLLQCLVFGLAHGYQGWKPIALTAVFGLGATLLTLWRRNLYAAMTGHAVTDIVGGLWP
jgi:membrane protease YdiL (CAAX protease family)